MCTLVRATRVALAGAFASRFGVNEEWAFGAQSTGDFVGSERPDSSLLRTRQGAPLVRRPAVRGTPAATRGPQAEKRALQTLLLMSRGEPPLPHRKAAGTSA